MAAAVARIGLLILLPRTAGRLRSNQIILRCFGRTTKGFPAVIHKIWTKDRCDLLDSAEAAPYRLEFIEADSKGGAGNEE